MSPPQVSLQPRTSNLWEVRHFLCPCSQTKEPTILLTSSSIWNMPSSIITGPTLRPSCIFTRCKEKPMSTLCLCVDLVIQYRRVWDKNLGFDQPLNLLVPPYFFTWINDIIPPPHTHKEALESENIQVKLTQTNCHSILFHMWNI